MALHYLLGDATDPILKPALLPHVCNSGNGWGRGYVLALSAKWPEPEKEYHNWFATGKPQLGDVQFVQVKPDISVANIIGQEGTHWKGGVPPIRYAALTKGLTAVFQKAKQENLTVHAPRLGAKLAGGDWSTIEKILLGTMTVETYIYTLPREKKEWPGTVYENDVAPDTTPTTDIDLSSVFK